ncbi:hypothetical protein PPYR_04475 [Photinus pyralis]|uniref:Tubulin--tyrosine ligase-like protein 9 n=1 Tax=Photinus pyralis TaxID=7054 RepID=A0A1Y1L213_PHOPY|nr:tubulin polyglutamylase ttll6-like [Photinus pyralis]KAB0802289.1 hypothetical protein PPYR_04475 [Photinus pyralis]
MHGDNSRSSLPFQDGTDGSDSSAYSDKSSKLRFPDINQNDALNKNFKKEIAQLTPTVKKRKKRKVSVCLTNCRYDVVRRIAAKFAFQEVADNDNWNFNWTDLSISIERCKEMKRYQRINHFPGMLEICRKDLLARNLNRMQRLFPKEYNFFPQSWCLPADLGEALAYSRLKKNKTYILKPDAGCQGRGIYLTKTLKDIKPTDKMVCQVYISRPFLIDGFKFDLRVYTLITSCDPLRIYVYKEGLCRFATSRYKEPSNVNMTNVFMHLTNYAVNKHSRTFNFDTQVGSKRKLSWLRGYLQEMAQDVDKLWHKIDDVIIKTIICAWPVLKHSYIACFPNHDIIPACCELLGIDVILDNHLNPQVLEVNHSPSFHTDTDLDCEVKETLLKDMFNMLNLGQCDKRRVIREDKKKIRERLLHGVVKDNSSDQRSFTQHYKHEMEYKGDFRLVYPTAHSECQYGKLFNQGQGSLYSDTVCSRARESAQTALRDEIVLKAKLEASKRVSPVKSVPKSRSDSPRLSPSKQSIRPIPFSIRSSFQPQIIQEAEERERLQRLAQRDFLVRSTCLTEQIYFSLKRNGVLRSNDEQKYQMFAKPRTAQRASALDNRDGPAIADFIEGIKTKEIMYSNIAPSAGGLMKTEVIRTVHKTSHS